MNTKEQLHFESVRGGQEGEKFEAAVKEGALKDLEGLGISVPKSIVEGKEGEQTYFNQYVELYDRMSRMAQEMKKAKGEEAPKEARDTWKQQLELIGQMRPPIFTPEQDQRFKDALKTWNRRQRNAFENFS